MTLTNSADSACTVPTVNSHCATKYSLNSELVWNDDTCTSSTGNLLQNRTTVYTSMDSTYVPEKLKIKDIKILIPNKVVEVTFSDNSIEKAICHENDKFDLERAITVCIAKHFLGGSSKYNNFVEKGIKLFNNKVKAEEDAKKEQERNKLKWKKKHEKLMKRIAKREKEKSDARIKELAKAIMLAEEWKHTKGV